MNTIYKITLYFNLLKYFIRDIFTLRRDKYELFLRNYFINKKKGFYIDVGCYHPIRLSNTFFLFKKGWNGINLDISEKSIDLFNIARKNDINLNIGVGSKNETTFGYFEKNLFFSNTLNRNHAKTFLKQATKKKIKIVKLQNIINKYAKNKKIDFLDIDCEGEDLEVLKGIKFKKNNIELISIEMHAYNAKSKKTSSLISKILKKNKYDNIYGSCPGTLLFKKNKKQG